jgi:hypothetical protein
MPALTFAQAYAIVCPDGGEVTPYSKEFQDIQELMRQSGHVLFQDRLVTESVPRVPQTVQEAMPYIARQTIDPAPQKISKREWLSITKNREAFLNHLNKK